MRRHRWTLLGVLLVAALAATLVAVLRDAGGGPVAVAPTTSATPSSPAPSSPAPSSVAPSSGAPGPARPSPSGTAGTPSATPVALRPGARGPEVLALQQRLVALGFWLGTPDGSYGGSTQHAVSAFQKANGLSRDGVAGPVTMAALARAGRPRVRSTSGRVFEVDLTRQLLLLAEGGRAVWIFDTSTGSVPGTTPTGRYRVFRQVDGYDPGPLGVLYRPKYFVGGVAVHGYPSVPAYPASHGCVRVTNAAMDWLWSSDAMPVGTPVWVY